MSFTQTIQERYGDPPAMKEKARLRLCDKCKENGKNVYLYWGDTGVPKKNDPSKNVVLPVEQQTGQWHECPYREPYNPQGNGTQVYRGPDANLVQPRAQGLDNNTQQVLVTFLQAVNEQNKGIVTLLQSLTASMNHAVEYLEIIASSNKTGPTPLEYDTPNSVSGQAINLTEQQKESDDAAIEKEYNDYKKQFKE